MNFKLFYCIFFLFTLNIYSQNIINGKIIDKNENTSIDFVTIVSKPILLKSNLFSEKLNEGTNRKSINFVSFRLPISPKLKPGDQEGKIRINVSVFTKLEVYDA